MFAVVYLDCDRVIGPGMQAVKPYDGGRGAGNVWWPAEQRRVCLASALATQCPSDCPSWSMSVPPLLVGSVSNSARPYVHDP